MMLHAPSVAFCVGLLLLAAEAGAAAGAGSHAAAAATGQWQQQQQRRTWQERGPASTPSVAVRVAAAGAGSVAAAGAAGQEHEGAGGHASHGLHGGTELPLFSALKKDSGKGHKGAKAKPASPPSTYSYSSYAHGAHKGTKAAGKAGTRVLLLSVELCVWDQVDPACCTGSGAPHPTADKLRQHVLEALSPYLQHCGVDARLTSAITSCEAEADGQHTAVTVVVGVAYQAQHKAGLANLLHLWTSGGASPNLCDNFVARCHQSVDSLRVGRLRHLPDYAYLTWLPHKAAAKPVLLGSGKHSAVCEGNVRLTETQLQADEDEALWDSVADGADDGEEGEQQGGGAADGDAAGAYRGGHRRKAPGARWHRQQAKKEGKKHGGAKQQAHAQHKDGGARAKKQHKQKHGGEEAPKEVNIRVIVDMAQPQYPQQPLPGQGAPAYQGPSDGGGRGGGGGGGAGVPGGYEAEDDSQRGDGDSY